LGGNAAQRLPDCREQVGVRAGLGRPQRGLHFAPHHLDWVEIRRVSRQEPDAGSGGRDQGDGVLVFVRGEVVHHHDVARPQRRTEHRPHIGSEDFRVRRAVHGHARGRTIQTDRGDHRGRTPVAMRTTRDQSFPPGRAAAQAGHVRFGGRLVEEDKLRGIEPTLLPAPAAPRLRHVGPVLLGGVERLFL
jgi:hypothetical protein